MHPFFGTEEAAYEMAKLEKNQYSIISINYYTGNPFLRSGMVFNITFDDGTVNLAFNQDLYDSQQMETYINATPALYPLRFTAREARTKVSNLKKLSITQVHQGSTVFLHLRFFNFMAYTWYDEVGFEDLSKDYFVPIKISTFISKRQLKVNASMPTHGNKRLILDNYDLVAFVSLDQPCATTSHVLSEADKAKYPNAWRNLFPSGR